MNSCKYLFTGMVILLLCGCQDMQNPDDCACAKILSGIIKAASASGCAPSLAVTPFTGIVTLPGDVIIEMLWIEPGTYLRGRYPEEQDSYGTEDPQHQVTLTRGFWLGKYPITKRQWSALIDSAPWQGRDKVLDNPDSPAVYISGDDNGAYMFLNALNEFSGREFRLPSEAEWEYAIRAGTSTRFYWGDDPDYLLIDKHAWYWDNSGGVGNDYAHIVGQKLPNQWGLYDMSGNVWEWCEDWGKPNYPGNGPLIDPVETEPQWGRVIRGGAFYVKPVHCRSASRSYKNPTTQEYCYGFRIACY